MYGISVNKAGIYKLSIRYANAGAKKTLSLYANYEDQGQLSLQKTGAGWNIWRTKEVDVNLRAGLNYITLQCDSNDTGKVIIDYISVGK